MPEFYDNIFCQCGCGGKIEIKRTHKYDGIPNYIYNHHKRGRKQSQEIIEKRIKPLFGQKRTLEQRKNISNSLKGKQKSIEHKINLGISRRGKKYPKLSESKRGRAPWNVGLKMNDRIGDLNPNWKGGISCEPYCYQWSDSEYKESIKQRDGHRCLNPECNGKNLKLCLHHINYNKKDCRPSNLITICITCNSKANFDRQWHESWYNAIVYQRYYRQRSF